MRALVALLVLACGGDKPPGPPDDTDLTDTPDTDAPDTDAPGDPCDPDPCTGEPGTVCDGGFCSTSRVEVSGGDRAWQGQVTDLAAGVAWTFTTTPLGEGAQATLAAGGESLTVDVPDPAAMTLTWAGVTLDGAGPLTTEERAALDDLLATPGLADGLARVPLDLGCADTLLDEAAMAALLAPWQLVLKHDPRRLATIRAAAAASRCAWFSEPTAATPEAKPPTGNLLLGRDAPIPVVVGWLPVDADGEAEQAPAAAGDLWGPCGGLCRGACGVDCPWINCRRRELTWCEQHPGAGGNTGMKFDAVELDCGTATGCVNHDDCYDRCNVGYGCGSWGALACRSGPRGCDEVACLTYGTVRCSAWAAGVGPFESRITFTYPPNTRPGEPAVGELDLQTCPTDDGSLQWELAPPATPVAGAAGAESYCSGLTLDGHDDWRLPTIAELPMIEAGCPIVNCLDISVYGVPFCEGCPSGRGPGDAGCYLDPRLSGPCGTYWTSTVYEDFPGDPLPGRWVWSALAGAEYVQSSSTYAGYHARCVRP